MGLFGCCRRRGAGAPTAKDTSRTAEAPTTNASPCEEIPGEYFVLKTAIVRSEFSLESVRVAELRIGSTANVTEVVGSTTQRQKVRGRIKDPAGWITLMDTATGSVMASRTMRAPEASSLKAGHVLLAMSELIMRAEEGLDSAEVETLVEDEALEVLRLGAGRRIQVKSDKGRVGWVSYKTPDGVPLLKQRISDGEPSRGVEPVTVVIHAATDKADPVLEPEAPEFVAPPPQKDAADASALLPTEEADIAEGGEGKFAAIEEVIPPTLDDHMPLPHEVVAPLPRYTLHDYLNLPEAQRQNSTARVAL